MSKTYQTSALRRAFDKIRSIPGHILDSYESGFKNVEDAHTVRDEEMKDTNGLNKAEATEPISDYHKGAQDFIKSAKDQGMGVQAEGSEIIATPTPKPMSKSYPVNGVGKRIIK